MSQRVVIVALSACFFYILVKILSQMSYSITIHVWDIYKQEFSTLYYTNEKNSNYLFEDILESYDTFTGFHTHFETSSQSYKKNIYDLARFLVNSHFTFQLAEGDSNEDKLVATLVTEFIQEILEEKEEKKLENLFNTIKSLPKKYCVNNSLSNNYVDEWIEVVFGTRFIGQFFPNWISTSKSSKQKSEIESSIKHSTYNHICIKQGKVPVFYFNHSDLIFFSFNCDWIDFDKFKYRDNVNLSNSEQLLDFEYTFFFYEEGTVINWILNLLKENNQIFNELINDSKLDMELFLLSDLVLKIFIKPKSFD